MPPAVPPGLAVEVQDAADPGARAAARTLVAAVVAAGHQRPVSDQAWLVLAPGAAVAAPVGEPAHDSPVVVLARHLEDDAGAGPELAGCAVLLPGAEAWAVELAVHPVHGGEQPDVTATLVETALDAARDRGATAVRWWMTDPPAESRALADGLGFTAERALFQLRVALPLGAEMVAGARPVAVRSFEPGRDEEEWLAVNNRAFRSHPEQGRWRPDDVLAREGEPWFDPAGFLLHEEGGRLAAFCWTKVHDDERPVLGEIYVIGVDPDFQGRGLGRSLTVAGLEHLGAGGVTVGMLYVDGDNAPARQLYASLGFSPHHVDRAYLRRLGGSS